MRSRTLLASLAILLGVLCAPTTASAYERQWHAGASVGYGLLTGGGLGANGIAGGLHVAYGLTDAFNLIGHVDVSEHPSEKLLFPSVSAGLSYVIDITQAVPYVGLTAGAADIFHTDAAFCATPATSCHRGKLALGIPWGIDYQLSRSVALGVVGHYQLLLIGDSPISHITASAHVELMWGY